MDLREIYRKNPFCVLSATPKDTRETLIRLQGDLALFGDAAEASEALTCLLHPQNRLEAEMRWFPQTDQKLISALFAWLDDPAPEKPMPRFILPCHLANFNFTRLILSVLPIADTDGLHAVFRSLSVAADTLLPRQVLSEINGDRVRAGFALLDSPDAIQIQLGSLLQETVRFTLARCENTLIFHKKLSEKVKQDYTDRASPYHNSRLMRIAAEELAQAAG